MVSMSLGDISVTKWEDKKDVNVNSNAHMPIMMDSVNRHDKNKNKSKVAHIYINHFLGID